MHVFLTRFFLLSLFSLLSLPCNAQAKNDGQKETKNNQLTILISEERLSHGKLLPTSEYLIALLEYLERESGVQLVQKKVPWNRALKMAHNGDGVIYGVSKTVERLQNLQFSHPIAEEYVWGIYATSVETKIESVRDLSKFIVIIPYGVSYGPGFEEAKKTQFRYAIDYNSLSDQLRMIHKNPNKILLFGLRDFKDSKEVSVFLHTKMIPLYSGIRNENMSFNISSQPLFYDAVHFATTKNKHIKEMEKLNVAIQKGVKNGEIPKIMKLQK